MATRFAMLISFLTVLSCATLLDKPVECEPAMEKLLKHESHLMLMEMAPLGKKTVVVGFLNLETQASQYIVITQVPKDVTFNKPEITSKYTTCVDSNTKTEQHIYVVNWHKNITYP
jgi:hypothetical protein